MLTKLIKYDFKAVAKSMFPIYLAIIVLSVLLSLMIKLQINESSLIFVFITTLFGFSITGSFVDTLIFVVRRFKDGLLKNEGYLSFALPVKISTHIVAKVINAVIWSIIQCMVILLITFIMGLFLSNFKDIVYMFEELIRAIGLIKMDVVIGIVKVLVIISLNLLASICLIYSAYAIAHLFNNKYRTIVMVIYYVFVTVFASYVLSVSAVRELSEVLLYILPIIWTAIYSLITWYILDRKLNLE